ncbi:ABC transporter G family member 42 [Platanthera guangdongensis]|uniref:ABC transporter G family member 42 n=1 Tax=Platanthera guangdongensis TaxID=2320717 RepID=A0ABR2LFS3_9ASPA
MALPQVNSQSDTQDELFLSPTTHVSSTTEDDGGGDEEVRRQWPAIERLPSLVRLRSSLFRHGTAGGGKAEMRVVDVARLDAVERRRFVDNFIRDVVQDNRRMLEMQRERLER